MRKLLGNFLYQASYQLMIIILPILTIPIVSRALGPEGIGTWNYIQSVMNYFLLLAGLGLSDYGIREIAIVSKNKPNLSKKFWELEGFNFLFTSVTSAAYIVVVSFMQHRELYYIQSLVLIGSLLDITWFFSGIEDFKKIMLSGALVKIVSFVMIIFLVKDQNDLKWYILIQSLSVLCSQAVLWFFIKDKILFVKVSIKDITKHIIPASRFFISKIAMTIYMNLNKTLLGIMTTMTIVGYYSNSLTLVTLSGSLITALNTVLIPRMSKMYADKNEKKLISGLKDSLHFQIFLTIPIAFGIVLISPKLVDWFFGEEFRFIKNIIPLLAPVVIVQSLQSGIAAQYLIPKNDMRSYNLTVIFGALVSLLCNLIFIPIIGIYGAVLATIMGQTTVCVVRVYVLLRNTEFRFNTKLIFNYIISSFSMMIVIGFFTKSFPSSWGTTFIQIILGFLFYMVVTMLCKSNPLFKIWTRIRRERQ